MSAVWAMISSLVTNAITWMGQFASEIVATTTTGSGSEAVTTLNHPVLVLFVVAIPLVGLGVGLLKRLIRV